MFIFPVLLMDARKCQTKKSLLMRPEVKTQRCNEDERVALDTAHNDQSWRQTLKGL